MIGVENLLGLAAQLTQPYAISLREAITVPSYTLGSRSRLWCIVDARSSRSGWPSSASRASRPSRGTARPPRRTTTRGSPRGRATSRSGRGGAGRRRRRRTHSRRRGSRRVQQRTVRHRSL